MCIDNTYLFDCKCVSTDGADVYEFNYAKFEKFGGKPNVLIAEPEKI